MLPPKSFSRHTAAVADVAMTTGIAATAAAEITTIRKAVVPMEDAAAILTKPPRPQLKNISVKSP